MKITVCIGSSCHIKGSRQVVEQLQDLGLGVHEHLLEFRAAVADVIVQQRTAHIVLDHNGAGAEQFCHTHKNGDLP